VTLISLINSTEHSLVVDMVVDMAYQHLEGTAVLLHLRPLHVRLLLEPIPSVSLALYLAGYTHLTFSCPLSDYGRCFAGSTRTTRELSMRLSSVCVPFLGSA
jgi:hypothetical protein